MRWNGWALLVGMVLASAAWAQTTSVGHRAAAQRAPGQKQVAGARGLETRRGNPTLEKHSLIGVQVKPPRKFQVHDLITIIIREQRKFESDAEAETKKDFDVKSTLNAFFKPDDQALGAATFGHGKPNIDFQFASKLKNEADKDREDRFTTRITAEVIDIKPNGNLVLEATGRMTYEDEVSTVTLTGTCRSVDVTLDNTVLSTQLANKDITVHNSGAVRDGTRRGWIPRLLDWLRPI